MRIMSIIGLVWFSISLFLLVAFLQTDVDAAMGWGILGLLYAVPYSIVGIVTTKQKNKSSSDSTQELLNLHELKEKGIITDEEFQNKKSETLRK